MAHPRERHRLRASHGINQRHRNIKRRPIVGRLRLCAITRIGRNCVQPMQEKCRGFWIASFKVTYSTNTGSTMDLGMCVAADTHDFGEKCSSKGIRRCRGSRIAIYGCPICSVFPTDRSTWQIRLTFVVGISRERRTNDFVTLAVLFLSWWPSMVRCRSTDYRERSCHLYRCC